MASQLVLSSHQASNSWKRGLLRPFVFQERTVRCLVELDGRRPLVRRDLVAVGAVGGVKRPREEAVCHLPLYHVPCSAEALARLRALL